MRQGLPVLLQRSIRQRPWEAPAFSNLKTRKVSCDTLEEALQQAEENRKKRQMVISLIFLLLLSISL